MALFCPSAIGTTDLVAMEFIPWLIDSMEFIPWLIDLMEFIPWLIIELNK